MDKEESAGAKKKVDEDWKAQVEQEKSHEEAASPRRAMPQESPFLMFISTLTLQAYIALGESPDPTTGNSAMDLAQAKYMIDILGMLETKTKGNLTAEESDLMTSLLCDVRMKFVEKTKKTASGGVQGAR